MKRTACKNWFCSLASEREQNFGSQKTETKNHARESDIQAIVMNFGL